MIFRSAKITTSKAELAAMEPKPKVVVEFGTFVGTSAIAWGAMLQEFHGADAKDIKVFTFEFDPAVAAIARSLIKAAGMQDVIEVLVGAGAESLKKLHAEGRVKAGQVDVVFIDHWEKYYLPDLKLCEELQLFHVGSLALADNTDMPGAPDYLAHVKKGGEGPTKYESRSLQSESSHGPVRYPPPLAWSSVARSFFFSAIHANILGSRSSRSARLLQSSGMKTDIIIMIIKQNIVPHTEIWNHSLT